MIRIAVALLALALFVLLVGCERGQKPTRPTQMDAKTVQVDTRCSPTCTIDGL